MARQTRRKGGRKSVPWAGWGREAPFGAARTRMFRKCGYKCFLGTHTPGDKEHPDFPICTKETKCLKLSLSCFFLVSFICDNS